MSRRKTVNLPPSFMSKDLEILVSHYGHPHTVDVVRIGDSWGVICLWATREKILPVGSREEADIVAASVKSDFMP
jgi:hypothetical protein